MVGEIIGQGLSNKEMMLPETETTVSDHTGLERDDDVEVKNKHYEIWIIDKYSHGKQTLLNSEDRPDTSYVEFRSPEEALKEYYLRKPENRPVAVILGLGAASFAEQVQGNERPKLVANSPQDLENDSLMKAGLVDFSLSHKESKLGNYSRIIDDILG